jgi:hypothetical protein
MKKLFIIIVIILSIFGCATFETALSDLNTAVSDMGNSDNEGIYLNPMFEFSIFYATHMLLIGYGFEEDNFKEGEGVTWQVSNVNNGEEITVKRALLKNIGNESSWWQLSSDADGKTQYYEMLIDDDANILKVRYRDYESNTIKEIIPEQTEETSDNNEDNSEEWDQENYGEYSVGKETVKTKAGSFKTEHIIIEDDESDVNEFRYEYWLSEKVPGTCVKYVFNNISENETMTGEVIDIRGGYKTQLESY